jgi:peptide/nickel transport system permease protein
VLPNVFGLVLANTTLTVAIAIYLETTMSFLGVGPRDTFSWGRILEEAFSAGALTLGLWAWFIPPGLAVVLVVLAFTLVGSAFDEILDPRLRSRGRGPHGAGEVVAAEVVGIDADIASRHHSLAAGSRPAEDA